MATAEQLEKLDEAHRLQQVANAGALVVALNATWREVDTSNLAATGANWLTRAISLILGRRRLSTLYALDYTRKIRDLQLGPSFADLPVALTHDFTRLIAETKDAIAGRGTFDAADLAPIEGVPTPSIEQIRESLIHTGLRQTAINQAKIPDKRPLLPPAAHPDETDHVRRENERIRDEWKSIDELNRGLKPAAQQRAGAAAVRHVHNGGRDASMTVVKADLKARGYVRVTRPGCCHFCAMLASRGPVYSEDSFLESDAKRKNDPRDIEHGTAKVHDECGCHLRAVYTRDGSEWTTVARESSDIWEEIRREKGRVPTINDFRHAWDARNATMQ